MSEPFKFDHAAFMRDAARIMEIQGRSFEDVITEQSRGFVRDAISITRPFGKEPMTEGTSVQHKIMMRAVMRDTRRAFRTLDSVQMIKETPAILDVIRHHTSGGPVTHSGAKRISKPSKKVRIRKPQDKIGAAILRCHKAGASQKTSDLIYKAKLRVAGVVYAPTKELHDKLREYEGGVPKRQSFLVLSGAKTVEAFGKELQKHAGLGKSGWVKAANALLAGTGASNSLRRKLGAWITRHHTAGVFSKEGTGSDKFSITVGNAVPFIQKDKDRIDERAWNNRNRNIRLQVAALEKWSKGKLNSDPLTRGSVN